MVRDYLGEDGVRGWGAGNPGWPSAKAGEKSSRSRERLWGQVMGVVHAFRNTQSKSL